MKKFFVALASLQMDNFLALYSSHTEQFLHRNLKKYYCMIYLLKTIGPLKLREGRNKPAY